MRLNRITSVSSSSQTSFSKLVVAYATPPWKTGDGIPCVLMHSITAPSQAVQRSILTTASGITLF